MCLSRASSSRYSPATRACASSFSSWLPSSSRMSATRDRFSRVSARRDSVSLRRSLYFETPAASSRKTRSSSGFASITREIMPCSMIAYARGPRPVPRNRSWMSRRRTGMLLM